MGFEVGEWNSLVVCHIDIFRMEDKSTSKTNQSLQQLDSNFHSGKSSFTFPNGDKYQGGYCAHRSGVVWREGLGTYTTKDGQVYTGLWVDDKLHEEGQIEIRFPSGAEYYGNLVNSEYTGSAMYVIEQNMNLLCELSENKPTGELLLIDVNGEEWHGTAGEVNAVLLPEHAFFKAISSDLGKGPLRKGKSLLEETKNKAKGKQPKRDQEEANREEGANIEKARELELKIFAKTKKTVSDLKFEESEWYQKYQKFKNLFEEITGKVENEGVDSLDPKQKEWYEKYLDFKRKYVEIMKHRMHKEKNLSDYKLFELYNSDEYKNSCPPISVFYPSDVVADDKQAQDETEPIASVLGL